MSQTLFEKYGRTPAISVIVKSFYKQVMAQQQLRGYFSGVPLEKLIEHQIAFVSVAMGEDASAYTGRNMADAHRHLRVTEADFDLVVHLFGQTLKDGGIEPADIAVILDKVSALKSQIVSA
ncbi:MAG: hypothetical protein RL618_679 [Pseudomonadota bacterium]|jgi:hemoglobin|nr:group 1 truncated hemoglobin [Oxalobacteraceae bacterium]